MSERGMLSRLAESLFWIGRYVERADDTSRIVDSYVHRIVEDPFNDEDATCRSLFAILGVTPPTTPLSRHMMLETIVYDEQRSNSIAGSLQGAYENARRSRDFISSEMWVALNTTRNELGPRTRRAMALGPSTYLDYVRERCALLAGLTDATLSHDDGWHFLVLGRSIERIDMTTRLLRGRVAYLDASPDWMAFLRASGAIEAFMRTTHQLDNPSDVATFLLLDRLFPRSVLASLNVIETSLNEIASADDLFSHENMPRQTLAQVRIALERTGSDEFLSQLPDLLVMLQSACYRLTDAITDRYFRHDEAILWESEDEL
jgi:uncharacterized alpha-E superfamily protein